MKQFAIAFLMILLSGTYIIAQPVVASYDENLQDTVYTINSRGFLYDHSGEGDIQLSVQCANPKDCWLYLRLDGDYSPHINDYRELVATTNNIKFNFGINDWTTKYISEDRSIFEAVVEVNIIYLKMLFGSGELLRLHVGGYSFTVPEDVKPNIDALYERLTK